MRFNSIVQIQAGAVYVYICICVCGGTCATVGERAKRARHYHGCTNSSWCGTCIYIYICIEAHEAK